MSKIEEIRQAYLKDADMMGSKSRFGYFSIPPCAGAGSTQLQTKKIVKDQNGKVKTQQRNIFSGITASGVLKKSYFNFQSSVFQGEPYADPGKLQRQQKLQQTKKLAGKDIYKPLNLQKTPIPKASYQHIPEKPQKKTRKDYIDENGKVKVQNRNIVTNSSSTIQKQKLKQLKYVSDPYQNHLKVQKQHAQKSMKLRGENPFKLISTSKPLFNSSRQVYGQQTIRTNQNIGKKSKKQNLNLAADHDCEFKPSCSKKFDTFSYPEYIPGGKKQEQRKSAKNEQTSKQSFKLCSPLQKSKPSPSVSTLRSNILRCLR